MTEPDELQRLTDATTREKLRADAQRRASAQPGEEYWLGYRIALTRRHEDEETILGGVGTEDAIRDARGRGYRDGRAWVVALETVGSTMAKERAARPKGARRRRPRKQTE